LNLPRIGLVVSATIVIDPSALALVASGDATPVLAPLVEKTWSKDELRKKLPANPMKGLDARLADEVTEILRRMAANQRGDDERKQQKKIVTEQPSKEDYLIHLDALKSAPSARRADGDAIREYFGGQSQKAGSDHIKERVELIKKLQNGLNFDLNLGSMFVDTPNEKMKSGSVRYGLVLKDIKADPNAPQRAAISDSSDELQYAGHADVEWTIGPLSEAHGRSVYSPSPTPSASESKGIFGWLRTPKPSFKGRAKPEIGNLAGVSGDSLPNWTVELYQEEGYYTLVYKSKSTGERLSQEHQLKLPLYGDLAVGRRFNDKWEAIETTAYNVLIDKNLPIVSLHHMHIEERYRVNAAHRIGPHKIGVEHQSVALNEEVVKEKDRLESYAVKYEREF
jgi:hypothetical protein